MAQSPVGNDLMLLLRGLGRLGTAAFEVHGCEINKAWSNSSLKPLAVKGVTSVQKIIIVPINQADLSRNVKEAYERLSVVGQSIKAYGTGVKNIYETPLNSEINNNLPPSEMNIGQFLQVKDQPPNNSNARMIDGEEQCEKILQNLDTMATIPVAVAATTINQVASDTQFEISKRIKNFEPMIARPLGSAGVITDEQIEAIDKKLLELQGLEQVENVRVMKEVQLKKPERDKGEKKEEIEDRSNDKRDYKNEMLNENSRIERGLKLEDNGSEERDEKLNEDNRTEGRIKLEDSGNEEREDNIGGSESVEEKTAMPKSAQTPKLIGRKPLAKDKAKSTLSSEAQARKVPQSRISRMVSFGGLAAGLGMGTIAEMTRRTLGVKGDSNSGSLLDASPFLTEANARRIVDTLCKVRGAALKLGQMMSIQDNSLINPHLQKIFERVRQSADFMPTWQLERTLLADFGPDWRSLVATFDDKPFAAASIGQVHQAILHDGRSVAMKIQYPGVADGIESDINNLISTLSVANILPQGLFIDSIIEVAKRELSWECDYAREKECTKRFKKLLQEHSEYYVPEVIDELCTKQVFTTELIDGISVDKCVSLNQESRNYIARLVLRLCLMEVFEFGFMQTDPNWSNFFYNNDTQQLALVDFGACRDYDKQFVDKYINVIHGAAVQDREMVYEYSKQLGFLTGYEAKVMINAHVDAVMILGEAFQHDTPFNFGAQETAARIQQLVPVMLSHRMCPPPEESYSLHRKMSGVFLLCAKLKAEINCKPFFDDLWSRYKTGGSWETYQEAESGS